MNYNYIFILFILLVSSQLNSQVSPLVDVGFDDCVFEDAGTMGVKVDNIGNLTCGCGIVSESVEFDGTNDGLNFGKEINSMFNSDFTLEMYFSVLNVYDVVDLFSFSRECDSDSSFSLVYLPSTGKLRFLAQETVSRSIELDIDLDPEKCWHHFALVRRGFSWTLYLDGEVEVLQNAVREYTFSPDNTFSISNSHCLNNPLFNYRRFKGKIDNFKVYNIALSNIFLRKNNIKSDQILNEDLTIFLGDQVPIEMSTTCAESFNWTNKQDLDDPNSLTPVIMPKKSTTYHVYFNMKGKTCRDSINIYVKDKDELDCSKILLPSAFTPNNDGLNDVYGISNKYIVEELKSLEIYSRAGSKVFETNDINGYWDGNCKDVKLNPAKYVYSVRYVCGGEEYHKKGIVNLVR